MEFHDEIRKRIETEFVPQLSGFHDVHLDLKDTGWTIYRQEDFSDAEIYYAVSGKYDQDGIRRLEKLFDHIRAGGGTYWSPYPDIIPFPCPF